MINPSEWRKTRKNLLEQVKSQVEIRMGKRPADLRRYAAGLERDFKKRWQSSDRAELLRAVKSAAIVLSGDFHAYAQSQRAHLRVLREIGPRTPIVLALECLRVEDEPLVRQLLASKISEKRFLQGTDWARHWGFPWENYRPLFEFARDQKLEVRALNRPGNGLKARDAWMARRLLKLRAENPDALIFVVVGELHVAEGHLPKLLKAKLNSSVVTLVQDAEPLYFKLAAKARENSVDTLRLGRDKFCMMVSPPWMKWQSTLMFLEHTYDRDLQEDLAIDYTDQLVALIEVLESDLKIKVKKSSVQVYCASAKAPLNRLRLKLPKAQDKALLYHLGNDQSFLMPHNGWFYLSRPTINHASTLAGQFVHAQLSRRTRVLWNMPEDFLAAVWIEAIGFFFSKWMNPKRKSETLAGIRVELAARRPKDHGRSALLLALDHRMSEVMLVQTGRARKIRFSPRDRAAFLEASRIVGSMLGERLFQKVRSRTISLPKLMSYLKVSVDGPAFEKFYWSMIREVEHDQAL